MAKSKESLRGLGVKYGTTLRRRYTAVFRILKKRRRCPICGSERFKRKVIGIWICPKCNYTVAGRAYDIKFT